jgi:hypothetical protein
VHLLQLLHEHLQQANCLVRHVEKAQARNKKLDYVLTAVLCDCEQPNAGIWARSARAVAVVPQSGRGRE